MNEPDKTITSAKQAELDAVRAQVLADQEECERLERQIKALALQTGAKDPLNGKQAAATAGGKGAAVAPPPPPPPPPPRAGQSSRMESKDSGVFDERDEDKSDSASSYSRSRSRSRSNSADSYSSRSSRSRSRSSESGSGSDSGSYSSCATDCSCDRSKARRAAAAATKGKAEPKPLNSRLVPPRGPAVKRKEDGPKYRSPLYKPLTKDKSGVIVSNFSRAERFASAGKDLVPGPGQYSTGASPFRPHVIEQPQPSPIAPPKKKTGKAGQDTSAPSTPTPDAVGSDALAATQTTQASGGNEASLSPGATSKLQVALAAAASRERSLRQDLAAAQRTISQSRLSLTELQHEMQSQIDALKSELSSKNAQLKFLTERTSNLQPAVSKVNDDTSALKQFFQTQKSDLATKLSRLQMQQLDDIVTALASSVDIAFSMAGTPVVAKSQGGAVRLQGGGSLQTAAIAAFAASARKQLASQAAAAAAPASPATDGPAATVQSPGATAGNSSAGASAAARARAMSSSSPAKRRARAATNDADVFTDTLSARPVGLSIADARPEAEIIPEKTPSEKLQILFQYFCAFGDRMNMTHMTGAKFAKLIKDAGLLSHSLQTTTVDLVFNQIVINSSPDGRVTSGSRLAYDEFVDALHEIAARRFGSDDADAFRKLVKEYMLPLYESLAAAGSLNADASATDDHVQGRVELTPDLVDFYNANKSAFLHLFARYAKADVAGGAKSWKDVRSSQQQLSPQGWLKLCQDFHIVPAMLSRPDVLALFKAAGAGSGADGGLSTLSYPQFIELFTMLAVRLMVDEAQCPTPLAKVQMLVFNIHESGATFEGEEMKLARYVLNERKRDLQAQRAADHQTKVTFKSDRLARARDVLLDEEL